MGTKARYLFPSVCRYDTVSSGGWFTWEDWHVSAGEKNPRCAPAKDIVQSEMCVCVGVVCVCVCGGMFSHLMDEFNLDTHLFPMVVTLDHHRCNMVKNNICDCFKL